MPEAEEEDSKPAAKTTQKKLDEKLASRFKKIALEPNDDSMLEWIVTYLTDVECRFRTTGLIDLCAIQVTAPAGVILNTFEIVVDEDDRNIVSCSCLKDRGMMTGACRGKLTWERRNSCLSRRLVNALQFELNQSGKVIDDQVELPDWNEKTVTIDPNALDPYVIDFRPNPVGHGESLYEIERVELETADGKVVPSYVITAFFEIEQKRHIRTKGDLRINQARGQAKRRGNDGSDDEMDGGNEKPSPPKKRPGRRASFSTRTAATIGICIATAIAIVAPLMA